MPWQQTATVAAPGASRWRGSGSRAALPVPVRPRDRRVPEQQQAHRATWPWPCWPPSSSTTRTSPRPGSPPTSSSTYHMSFSFYVGSWSSPTCIGAFASLPASKTDKLGRSNVVIYGLLLVGLLVAVGVPATHDRVAVRHRHLRPRPGRGGHPGGHPGPGPRLQPPAGPGLGHGLLDRRPGGRQPDHLASWPTTPSTTSSRSSGAVRMEEPVPHLGHHLAGGLRDRPLLHEGPVVAGCATS